MNKTYQKSFPGEKNAGFTLIELLVVVLIIGILAAVALPQYEKAVEKSRAVQAFTFLDAWVKAQQLYYLANGSYYIGDPSIVMKDMGIEAPSYDSKLWTYTTTYDIVYTSMMRLNGDEGDSFYNLVVLMKPEGVVRYCTGREKWCKAINNGAGKCSKDVSPNDPPWCYWK